MAEGQASGPSLLSVQHPRFGFSVVQRAFLEFWSEVLLGKHQKRRMLVKVGFENCNTAGELTPPF